MQENNQKIYSSTGLIIIKEDKIFLAKRTKGLGAGKWGTMGGHIELGETPEEAAAREAKEEFNIEVGNLKFLYLGHEWYGERQYLDVVFTADIISGEPKNMEPEKKSDLGWFDINNLPGELFKPVEIGLEAIKTGEKYFKFRVE
jgi:8-oxo-dGTP diphosphatase